MVMAFLKRCWYEEGEYGWDCIILTACFPVCVSFALNRPLPLKYWKKRSSTFVELTAAAIILEFGWSFLGAMAGFLTLRILLRSISFRLFRCPPVRAGGMRRG